MPEIARITQEIMIGQYAQASQIEQSVVLPSIQQRIYLDLALHEEGKTSERKQTTKQREKYHLVVTPNYDSYPRRYVEQQSVLIESDIELRLLFSGLPVKKLRPDLPREKGQPWIMMRSAVASFRGSFTVELFKRFPTSEVTFELQYRREGKDWKTATTLRARLEGDYDYTDKELMQEIGVDIAKQLPKKMAMIHLVKQNNTFRLLGFDNRGKQLIIDSTGWDNISLAKLLERKDGLYKFVEPESYIGRVHGFSSRGFEKLNDWLNGLLAKCNKDLCIGIADHTDCETPWEMLEIQPGKYLGAVAAVVRMVGIKYFGQNILGLRDVQPYGSIISYLDGGNLGTTQTHSESSILKDLKAEHHKSLEVLKKLLQQPDSLDGVGLIYVGCHGSGGITIGSKPELVSFYALDNSHVYPDPRPICFINACDSARLIRDDKGFFAGLLITALRHFASGYIGSLGPVGSTHASKFAEYILRAASAYPDGIQVAEVLRQLREEAVREFAGDKSDKEKQYHFLYTFMYVYYGGPYTRLRLTKTAEMEEIQ